jgi:hypothetical protein
MCEATQHHHRIEWGTFSILIERIKIIYFTVPLHCSILGSQSWDAEFSKLIGEEFGEPFLGIDSKYIRY